MRFQPRKLDAALYSLLDRPGAAEESVVRLEEGIRTNR